MIISIIGTGNVAFHLTKRFLEKNVTVDYIIGREGKAFDLGLWNLNVGLTPVSSSKVQNQMPEFTTDYSKISAQTDLIIIAVRDDVIVEVAQKLSPFTSRGFGFRLARRDT